MAIFRALRQALWPTVDAEQRIADFHAEVDRLACEQQVQAEPLSRLGLAADLLSREIVQSSERMARRGKWGFWIVMLGLALGTATILVFK